MELLLYISYSLVKRLSSRDLNFCNFNTQLQNILKVSVYIYIYLQKMSSAQCTVQISTTTCSNRVKHIKNFRTIESAPHVDNYILLLKRSLHILKSLASVPTRLPVINKRWVFQTNKSAADRRHFASQTSTLTLSLQQSISLVDGEVTCLLRLVLGLIPTARFSNNRNIKNYTSVYHVAFEL